LIVRFSRAVLGYFHVDGEHASSGETEVLVLGLILLLLGYFLNIGILTTIGIILVVVGAVLWILGAVGRPVGGRRHYW
jgi:hypothetical protein